MRNLPDSKKAFREMFPLLLTLGLAVTLSGCGGDDLGDLDERRTPYPGFEGGDLRDAQQNFAYLINNYREGQPKRTPWAGAWWPYGSNGIAANSPGSGSSPAAKYDAVRCNTTKAREWEIKHHGKGDPKMEAWWGHCNGWSVAAALYPEPRESVTVNGQVFQVADIKGLITEAAQLASVDFYGNRVEKWTHGDDPAHDDVVPAQFFLILTNYMGMRKHPVLIDRFTGSQVWNQPLAGYRFEKPKKEDYVGKIGQRLGVSNVYGMNATLTIWWAEDAVPADHLTEPFNWQDDVNYTSRTLKMQLWLDGPVVFDGAGNVTSSGNIIVARDGDYIVGGKWDQSFGDDGHPDYVWVPYSIIRPDPNDPKQDYVNPHVDYRWVEKHLLVAGGADDPSCENPDRPRPGPSASPRPGDGDDDDDGWQWPWEPGPGDGDGGGGSGGTPPPSGGGGGNGGGGGSGGGGSTPPPGGGGGGTQPPSGGGGGSTPPPGGGSGS